MHANYAEGIIRYLQGADLGAALLRSQIAVEGMLGQAVQLRFIAPQYFSRLGLTAYRKVQLAAGLGLIEREEEKAFLQLNELRNRVAHRWSYDLTERDQNELVGAVPVALLERFGTGHPTVLRDPFPKPLRMGIIACFIMARNAFERELASRHGFKSRETAEFNNWLTTPEGREAYTGPPGSS